MIDYTKAIQRAESRLDEVKEAAARLLRDAELDSRTLSDAEAALFEELETEAADARADIAKLKRDADVNKSYFETVAEYRAQGIRFDFNPSE